ncbi:hypothetical protein Dda_7047 [Drechslerella dactyloides]|uniref:HTH CENPB-type domain-containing protein n=1 Tax=Drechslerella dactyloides TaxID=74499 RepID=A0AAD6NG00_DREDA|nr:hypothetical protein Dda_7047 [Drechslerella dactyloides]
MRPESNADYEIRIAEAITAWEDIPGLSLNAAARNHGVPASTLKHRVNGRRPRIQRPLRAPQQALTLIQEEAISKWIARLYNWGYPPRYNLIRSMADSLAGRQLNRNWLTRFLKRRPELTTATSRTLENRRGRAMDANIIIDFFAQYHQIVQKHDILPQNCWNMDETGFLIGYATKAKVVLPASKKHDKFVLHDGNRESVTMVECGSMLGEFCPPMVIFGAKTQRLDWHRDDMDLEGWQWAISEKGQSNTDLAVSWLKLCFHPKSYKISRPKQRLLLLDGHSSHISVAFIDFCIENRIIALCLPPHSTHVLQPLDLGAFSPYKRAYSRMIDRFCRNGGTGLGKRDFVNIIPKARSEALTKRNMKAGYKQAGLVPWDPLSVLEKLPNFSAKAHTNALAPLIQAKKLKAATKDPSTPQTPANEPAIDAFAGDIQEAIGHYLTTPLRTKFSKIIKVAAISYANEAILMKENRDLRSQMVRARNVRQGGGMTYVTRARVLGDDVKHHLVAVAEVKAAKSEAAKLRKARRQEATIIIE